MERILKAAVERGASDVHIKAGDVFRARIDGRLVPLTKHALTPEQTKAIAARLIPNEADRQRIDAITDYDCSWGAAGVGRFRVSVLRQRSSLMIVLRVIPFEVPTLEALRLPPAVARIAAADRGMVLVTGAAGSGKSSTLAALVHHVNAHANKHIVTLESPIEFLHRDLLSSVTQREVGADTESFKQGLRAALRQDPDVVMIGELRDAETIDTAMTAAETGRLVFGALHTPDAQSTLLRIVAMFPAEEQHIVRIRLGESLAAIVSQRLLPRSDGRGRVVAAEVLTVTPAVRTLILDNRLGEIREAVASGRDERGMQTLDQHLADLVSAGEVALDVALAAAVRPADVRPQPRAVGGPADPKPVAAPLGVPLGAPAVAPGAGVHVLGP